MDGWEAIAASAVPLTGGYGGETYAVSAAGEDAVLRLYVRDPARAPVDVSLLRLVRGLLPVPRMLDANPHCGLIANCSNGKWRDASSIRRRSSSTVSIRPIFVVIKPNTAILPFGTKRSGSKLPARSVSYSNKSR